MSRWLKSSRQIPKSVGPDSKSFFSRFHKTSDRFEIQKSTKLTGNILNKKKLLYLCVLFLKCTEDVNKKGNFPLIYRVADEEAHACKLLKGISVKRSLSLLEMFDVTALNLSANVPLVTRFVRCACTHIKIMKRNIVPK